MARGGLTDIVVGRDGRLSGPSLTAGLIDGLRKAGRNVIDIGLAPTPLALLRRLPAAHGLVRRRSPAATTRPTTTASRSWSAARRCRARPSPTCTTRIAEDRLHTADTLGSLQHARRFRGLRPAHRLRRADRPPLKVVVDAGNGVAGDLASAACSPRSAPRSRRCICEVDGTFPNHHPDPSEPHNLDRPDQDGAAAGCRPRASPSTATATASAW